MGIERHAGKTPLREWRRSAWTGVLLPLLCAAIAGAVPASREGRFASAALPAQPPAWSVNQPIYEVNLQTFSQAGTYKELERRLPKLKALGVGILWLMPITTRGVERAFGSPYCVRDYRGFHAPYGSEQDFRDLVAAVHSQGLHLILDWVPNHTSWDNALTREHKDFYKLDAGGNIRQAFDWSDVAQLDYANPALRAWMIESMQWWVSRYDIDGFRCDVAWGVPDDFWAQARTELDKGKPLFMLAEANSPGNQAAFNSNYDWDMMGVTQDPILVQIASGRKPIDTLDGLLAKDLRAYASPFMRMRFTSNHDEWGNFGTPAQRLGDALRPLAVLTAMLPGKPLLYNGQEIGWNPGNRSAPIEWNDTSPYLDFYGRMLRLHQSDPALYAGSIAKVESSDDAAIYAFTRSKDEDRVLVVLNLTGRSRNFTLSATDLAGAYTDLFTGRPLEISGTAAMTLGPWGYQVLVTGSAGTGLATLPGSGNPGVAPRRRNPDMRSPGWTFPGDGNRPIPRFLFPSGSDGAIFNAAGARIH